MNNKKLFRNIRFKAGEKIKKVVRRSVGSWFWPMLLSVLLIVLAFFFIYPLFLQGILGVVGFCVLLLVGLILAWRTYSKHYFTALIMTDRRLIDVDQCGLFGCDISEALYSKIDEVYSKSGGLWGAIFGWGDVYVGLSSEANVKLKFSKIRGAGKVASEILLRQESYLQNNQPSSERKVILSD
ncbi:MAG: hypothetical protein WC516_00975 [Patescibacteria group bacterium]